ncbi:MAG: SHOCT domain-containing protein [Bacillota bacterium]
MPWLCANALQGSGWAGLIMGGVMILFWVAILTIGYFLIKSLIRGSGNRSDVLRILQERFARGEINETEYEQMKIKLQ